MKKFIISLIGIVSTSTFAAQVNLFTFKKNLNPKNVLNYAINPTANCTLAPYSNGKYVNPYWIMGESDGHTEGLTAREQKIFTPIVTYINTNKTELDFNVAAVNEMKKHIPNPKITVRAFKDKMGACKVKSYLNIDNQEINLTSFYINGNLTIMLDWKTNYMIVSGLKSDGTAYTKTITP